MNKYFATTGFAIAAAAAGLLLAPTAAAADSAAVTIGQLEAQGFDVTTDRIGNAPLNECEVTGVRNSRVQRPLITVDDDDNNIFNNNFFDVERRSITVSLNCAR